MDLIKKNIHSERNKCRAVTQITLEEDVNISDQNPDALKIITQHGAIVIEEIHPITDYVMVKGKLQYEVLYLADEDTKQLSHMEGSIPFEEKIHMETILPNDNVDLTTQMEDLSMELIHSRKMSIRSLLLLSLSANELFDVELPVEVSETEGIEVRKDPILVHTMVSNQEDTCRLKEEIDIPQGMPNILQLLWHETSLRNVTFKIVDGKVTIQGELLLFVIYEGEGENSPIRYYETSHPFSRTLDFTESDENLTSQISYCVKKEGVEVTPDFDGEERVITVDIVLSITVKLMENKSLSMINDVYGITMEAEPVFSDKTLYSLLSKNNGKSKLSLTLHTDGEDTSVLQLCHVGGNLYRGEERITDNGIDFNGVVTLTAIYVTGNDENPYASISGSIPYSYHLDVEGIKEGCIFTGDVKIEQIQSVMSGTDEIEVKIVVAFGTITWNSQNEKILQDIRMVEPDAEKRNEMPGMVLYIAKEKDHIWNLGKTYGVPLQTIRQLNHLTKDELEKGDKILLVREE